MPIVVCSRCKNTSSSDSWENPTNNRLACPICDLELTSDNFERITRFIQPKKLVEKWRKLVIPPQAAPNKPKSLHKTRRF